MNWALRGTIDPCQKFDAERPEEFVLATVEVVEVVVVLVATVAVVAVVATVGGGGSGDTLNPG